MWSKRQSLKSLEKDLSLEELLDKLLKIQAKSSGEGKYPASLGTEITTTVQKIRKELMRYDDQVQNQIRKINVGESSQELIALLLDQETGNSFKVTSLINKDFVQALCQLTANAKVVDEADLFNMDFGTTRVDLDKDEDENEKDFLAREKPITEKIGVYMANRAPSLFEPGGDAMRQQVAEDVNHLQVCARAMLDLAGIEAKKGSRTGHYGKFLTQAKIMRDAYQKCNGEEKEKINAAIAGTGVEKAFRAIIDHKADAKPTSIAVALRSTLQSNEQVKENLSNIVKSNTPSPRSNK